MNNKHLMTVMFATILMFGVMFQTNIISKGVSQNETSQASTTVADPIDDLVHIYTGQPAEEYFEYVDAELVDLGLSTEIGELECTITVRAGPPVGLQNTVFYTLGFDEDNDPSNNCQDFPTEDIDTMYTVIYTQAGGWIIERAVYDFYWIVEDTDAEFGLASSLPGGFSIDISISLTELSELTETLPWKVKTETFNGASIGDFVPDEGLAYLPPLEVTFSQVDFTFTDANVPNSDWGRVEVDVSRLTVNQGVDEGYLNIYTDGGWVVQNMPIENASGMKSIAMYFNLSVQIGTDVTLLSMYMEFTGEPYVTFRDGPRSEYPVDPVKYNAEGAGPLQTTTIPTPLPLLFFEPFGVTWDFKKPNKEGENVQTADDQCFPMSIANSLQYLENRYGLPVPHDHKKGLKGDNSLVGKLDSSCDRGVRSRQDGDGVWFDDMLEGKFKYLSENGLTSNLIHKHQGHGYGWVDANHNGGYELGECQYSQGSGSLPAGDFTRHGTTSKDESAGGKVTFEWISDQLKKCEDVEVVFTYEDATGKITGGHAVRVFGCGMVLGIPYLWYKHDREQTSTDPTDNIGLEEVPVPIPDIDGDGMPNFGSKDQEICFALSESVPTIEGDINWDGVVDIFDVVLAAKAFGSTPGDSMWNQAADLNGDDVVDIFDIVILAKNFGTTSQQ